MHFRLRIPEALKNRIEAAALASRRSMTAEIIARLEQSVEIDDLHEKPGEQAVLLAPLLQAVDEQLRQRFEPYISSLNKALEVALDPSVTNEQRAEMRAGLAEANSKTPQRSRKSTKAGAAAASKGGRP
ncbi:hypothetical protein ASC89_22130 [Devosia sp. Root413D1]|nr:hypothetical protein ASC89_22130 [Devosia sp. Root413D1]